MGIGPAGRGADTQRCRTRVGFGGRPQSTEPQSTDVCREHDGPVMFRRDTPKRRGADASIPLRHGCGSWCRLPPVASCFGLVLTARGPELLSLMDTQRLSICGRIVEPDDPSLQDALAAVYETPERPRCLCVPCGVEMYVSFT